MKQKIIAEFTGTFVIIFVGTAAIIFTALTDNIPALCIPIIFGLTVTVMFYTVGKVSGAHFNPAITLALYFHGIINLSTAICYVLAQMLGAITASLILNILFGNVADLGATFPSGTWIQSFVVELFLTFILMLVILGSNVFGKALGLILGIDIVIAGIFGGPISGASMNPARSLGPAIVSGSIHDLWIYLLGPSLGAVAAIILYRLIKKKFFHLKKTTLDS